MQNSNKIVWVVVILVIIAGGVIFIQSRQKHKVSKTSTDQNQAQLPAAIKPVENTKLPEKFPADFPLEAGAQIEQNYNVETDGTFQATRRFVSKESLDKNYKLYTDYLNKNDWKIDASMSQTDVKSIAATKGGASVVITITKNATTAENVVDISFTYR